MTILIGLLALLLTTCSGLTGGPTIQAPQPAAGKATITARIISTVTNKPLADTMIRLAPINRNLIDNQPIFLLNESTSPGARTNANGDVVIANVDPQEYVMIVSSDMGDHAVVTDKPDIAKVWKLESGKVLNVGEIRVKYP
jgi:hypothetical protein